MAMTREALIIKLRDYAGDDYTADQSSFVEDCVDSAIYEVCNEMHPWSIKDDEEMNALKAIALTKYPWVINRIAQFHYDKQGKEGVTTFYEAGQTTSFGGSGTPPALLSSIVPMAKIV